MDLDLTGRRSLEKTLAFRLAESSLTTSEFLEWQACRFVHRALCHHKKVFCVWEQGSDGPIILDSLMVTDIHVSTHNGFSVSVKNHEGQRQWVTHKPVRLFDLPVFAHVPFMPDITFLPRVMEEEPMTLKFPLVYKTEGHPEYPVAGLLYLTQIGEFRATYPKFADLRL